MQVYTIGHSTRTLEDFIDVLKYYKIELLIDVRQFPGSRKFPWFNKENLEQELSKNKIQYIHFPELGGFRKGGYLAFTQTEEFMNGIKKLIEIIDDKNSAIMCAEILFWRCHRKYISEELVNQGIEAIHILNKEKTFEHKLKSKEIQDKMDLKILCDKKYRINFFKLWVLELLSSLHKVLAHLQCVLVNPHQ